MKKSDIKKAIEKISPEIDTIEYYVDTGKCFDIGVRVFPKRRKIQASDFAVHGCYDHDVVKPYNPRTNQLFAKNNWDQYDGNITELWIKKHGGSLPVNLNNDIDNTIKTELEKTKKFGDVRKIRHNVW